MKDFKLNYKITFVIGLAFFSIMMLWQVYNNYCSLMLLNLLDSKFEDENQALYIVGIIMAIDNIFAIFMLPLFGKLSDNTHSRFGKRMPYIVVGMVLAAIAFPFIPFFYGKGSLGGVIIMMLVILIIMQSYRTSAVSLMPDITPKPLRSRANGIINVVGYLGAIIAGALAMVGMFKVKGGQPIYTFLIVSVMLLFAVILLMITVRENKLIEETREDVARGEFYSTASRDKKLEATNKMSKKTKKNLLVLLLATFFWFAGFNAIETFLSIYTDRIYGQQQISGLAVIFLTVFSLITFIPAGLISERFGRKKTVAVGLIIIILGFVLGSFNIGSETNNPVVLYVVASISGIGWATVNVSSYPMVVEMSNQENIGKFTGYYYLFSMLAQSFTPIVVGLFMYHGGLEIMFAYASICMILSIIIFFFMEEHKVDKKVAREKAKNIFEYLDIED